MTNLDRLIGYFENFPGTGARQAKRFAFHILTLPKEDAAKIASLITSMKESVVECESCRSFFSVNAYSSSLCSICDDSSRDLSKLMVVEKDSDIQAIERSGTYSGLYFVLGGTVPLLNSRENNTLRGGLLKSVIEARQKEDLSEIILGFAVNPDGENTGRFVESILKEIPDISKIKTSYLGRGLSTGSELEYADPETIKNALKNRG